MPSTTILLGAVAALVVLGLFLLFSTATRLRSGRLVAGFLRGGMGLLLITLATAGALVASNLYTYARLTAEQPVAELAFAPVAGQLHQATLTLPDGRQTQYLIHGDEWQLDARVIKWRGYALLLGLDNYYRLERLSGRYVAIEQEQTRPRSAYELAARQQVELDLWSLARQHERWLPWVDAAYGSATYLPMTDGARFQVTLGATGLIARQVR